MISRRKILSRSRDDLNLELTKKTEDEEDVWCQKEKLFRDHIQEVLDKWRQIDDEIWAKVIVFERNRRVAKAYARAPVLTVNGSEDGFDGMRIGLCGFDNPLRDQKTDELKRHIGQGVKIKMDEAGNILVRRYSKSNVYVKSTSGSLSEETAIGNDILKSRGQCIEQDKVFKIFDIKKFQSNLNRELSRAYPDRRRLEIQCLSVISFVKSENDLLDCPIWVLIVNVVAMDMLKSKLPPVHRPVDIKNRPKIPIPDEDPYSIAGNGNSSGSSGQGASASSETARVVTKQQMLLQSQPNISSKRGEKPPKLPPRDNVYHQKNKPDYDKNEDENQIKYFTRGQSDKGKDNNKYDDPYYCGMRARVPNFVKLRKTNQKYSSNSKSTGNNYISRNEIHNSVKEKEHEPMSSSFFQVRGNDSLYQHLPADRHQFNMWHSRNNSTSKKTLETEESPYQIYGKLPHSSQNIKYVPSNRMFIGEWD